MKPAGSALLLVLFVQDPVCDHGSRGATRPLDLKQVARVHAGIVKNFDSFAYRKPVLDPLPSFDSGLPACRSRTTRRLDVDPLPEGMKPLYFASSGSRIPEGAVHVVTRARSIRDVTLSGDSALAARFGVRCVPTFVRPLSPTEVELAEGGTP